mmetsp:Transcript_11161/g.32387  ORF Transcript_11161/g.32387 Transcript_11161/m.32387 type:complete len:389 (+) Transcript_11161:515-1681(+)
MRELRERPHPTHMRHATCNQSTVASISIHQGHTEGNNQNPSSHLPASVCVVREVSTTTQDRHDGQTRAQMRWGGGGRPTGKHWHATQRHTQSLSLLAVLGASALVLHGLLLLLLVLHVGGVDDLVGRYGVGREALDALQCITLSTHILGSGALHCVALALAHLHVVRTLLQGGRVLVPHARAVLQGAVRRARRILGRRLDLCAGVAHEVVSLGAPELLLRVPCRHTRVALPLIAGWAGHCNSLPHFLHTGVATWCVSRRALAEHVGGDQSGACAGVAGRIALGTLLLHRHISSLDASVVFLLIAIGARVEVIEDGLLDAELLRLTLLGVASRAHKRPRFVSAAGCGLVSGLPGALLTQHPTVRAGDLGLLIVGGTLHHLCLGLSRDAL